MSVLSSNWYEAACPNSSTAGYCLPTGGYFLSVVIELPCGSLGASEPCALWKCFYSVRGISELKLAGHWPGPKLGGQLCKALISFFSLMASLNAAVCVQITISPLGLLHPPFVLWCWKLGKQHSLRGCVICATTELKLFCKPAAILLKQLWLQYLEH